MKYTGTYTNRKQVQRRVTLSRIIRTAAKIESADTMNRLLLITRQMQHTDSGNPSRAEQLRDWINVWTVYHDDIGELQRIFDMVFYISRTKQRQAERAAQQR